ncbi:hypothetical protein BC939DRAFT_529162 [Gamsiella multidivaricata]|uniref:uncharacterized protein n=1 Tax=Gamsiella multidivaricata TaxID=101098 RepID=UPI00221ECB17|nr:uncharacterized protein BC939DRAFT_529162 [Gamsiella multidivaricata]KAG0358457.1 hypothetical protein BGZ54_010403 [Gamsiella multidivaricata]KAI7822958.1 hypothetical protein BC939DRAFT_529162 [Gamsiella multidivaricata]
MDSLPEECLVHLLSFVALDPQSLRALQRTNKTFFRLSSPILYQNPFDYIEALESVFDRQIRKAGVLRLLLACSSAADSTLQDILSQGSSRVSTPPKPTIDYLSLYTSHSEKLLSKTIPWILPRHHGIQNTVSSSQQSTVATGTDDTTSKRDAESFSGQAKQLRRPLDLLQLHAKVHLALVGHSPQHIHTINFPVHNMSVLQPLVSQLPSLVRLELIRRHNREGVSGARQFIVSHRQHFSSLREIKITMSQTSESIDLSCLVQAMEEPRVVDVAGWTSADQRLSQFPLQRCQVLLMRLTTPPSTAVLEPAFLAGLSQLQTVRMPVFHGGMFSWAKPGSLQHSVRSDLKSVSLYGIDKVMVPALTDACDAFRTTLQEITALSSFGPFTTLFLTWNWSLPRLTRLDLEGTVAVSFDLESLAHCGALQELRLNIGRQIPADWDVELKVGQLARVSPNLRQLELSGWWGLLDAALKGPLLVVLKRLRRLNLMWCTGPSVACFIQIMPQLSALRWFGLSATAAEQDSILALKEEQGLVMDIDIQITRPRIATTFIQ